MSAIVARSLTKHFSTQKVLSKLELSIPPGSIYGLLGRNGAGKSTLLKLVMGLLLPSQGEVTVLGKQLGGASTRDKERVSYVAENSLLPEWMTINQLVRMERSCRAEFSLARLTMYLKREGLAVGRFISTLSKGQRKRIDFELALAGNPSVLVLDEPLDGLDPVSRAEATEALVAHVAQSGASALVSSHVLTDLERLCDRIGVLAGGRIAFADELDHLKETVCLVIGPKASQGRLPISIEVIGQRSDETGSAWLVRGLNPEQECKLREGKFQLVRPGLEELGVELIRCLTAREQRP